MLEQITANSYKFRLPKGEEAETSEISTAQGARPLLKLLRWGGECAIDFPLPVAGKFQKQTVLTNSIEIENANVIFRILEKVVGNEQADGIEFEAVFKRLMPSTISVPIASKNLLWYYQPELTQEEIDHGANRPENVVGSYAVYHATRTNFHASKADADKYRTGKAFHVYRPKLIDADGKIHWGRLDYDGARLHFIFNPAWVAAAKYPITLDPTFGYTSIGASTDNPQNDMYSYADAPASNGTVTSISAYLSATGAGDQFKAALYLNSTGASIANGFTDAVAAADGWNVMTFATNPSVTSGTTYDIIGGSNAYLLWHYDAVGTAGRVLNAGFATWDDPWTPGAITRTFSIYATMSAGGAEKGPVNSSVIVGVLPAASRALAIDRDSSVIIGELVSATRALAYTRAAAVISGIVVTATKIKGFVRTAAVIIGELVTATRGAATFTRNSTVIVGELVSATRAATYTRASSVLAGVLVSASKTRDVLRSAAVIVGTVVTATRTIAFTRSASVIVGCVAVATRAATYSRLASVAIGLIATAVKTLVEFGRGRVLSTFTGRALTIGTARNPDFFPGRSLTSAEARDHSDATGRDVVDSEGRDLA